MKTIKTFEKFNESLIGTSALVIAGYIGAKKLLNYLSDLYIRKSKISDSSALQSGDPNSIEFIDLLKKNIELGRNAEIEVTENDDEVTTYSSVGRKIKGKLFTINKRNLVLTGGYANAKIQLSKEQFEELDNLIYWYKK